MRKFKNINISGKNITLRSLKDCDTQACLKWFQDDEVTKFLSHNIKNISQEVEREWFKFVQRSENDLVFAIIENNANQYIGNCGLHKINWKHKNCELGIFIGNKNYWDKGLGTDAARTLIYFATGKLGITNIKLVVYEYNHRAIHVYKHIGFEIIEVLKDNHFYAGRYWDTYSMEYRFNHSI